MTLTIRVEAMIGDRIEEVCQEAVTLANRIGCDVQFEFNEVLCYASPGADWRVLAKNFRRALQSESKVKLAFSR